MGIFHSFRRSAAAALLLVVALQFGIMSVPAVAAAQADTSTAAATASTSKTALPSCSIWGSGGVGPAVECALANFMASILAGLVGIADGIFVLSGELFDKAVDLTVVSFGGWYQDHVGPAIESVWTVFRDLANILIIGMFVFIAISIILETKEFGRKALVVNVIIVAVLINFSLLFTKLVIDTSNFFAHSFYNASLPQSAPSDNPDAPPSQKTLAHSFEYELGVTSIGDTFDAIRGNLLYNTWDRFGKLLFATFISCTIFLAGAFTFFYGTFLLVMRAIMIIFLLFISSVAFASYLVPAAQRKILDPWVSALMNVAVLAPFMMLALWATLLVARKLPVATKLGTLFIDPKGADAIGSLLSFLIVLGMLYGSFLIAHKFSSAVAVGGITGVAGGAASIGGAFLGRNIIGRGAAFAQGRLEKSAQEKIKASAGARGTLGDQMAGKAFDETERKRKAAALAKSAVGNQLLADRIGKLAGAKFGGSKSFTGIMADRTKAAEAAAKKLQPDEETKKTIREEALKNAEEIHKQQTEALETTKKGAEETVKLVREAAAQSAEHQNAQSEINVEKQMQAQHEKNHEEAEKEHNKKLTDLRKEAAEAEQKGQADIAAERRAQMHEKEVERENDRKAETARIEKARQRVKELQEKLDTKPVAVQVKGTDGSVQTMNISMKDATESLTQATKALKEHQEQKQEIVKKNANEATDKTLATVMQGVAREMGQRSGTIPERLWGGITGDNAKVGEKAAKKFEYKKKTDKDYARDFFKKLREEEEGGKDEKKEVKK